MRFRAPSGVRGWLVRGCYGEKFYYIQYDPSLRSHANQFVDFMLVAKGKASAPAEQVTPAGIEKMLNVNPERFKLPPL